MPKIEIEYDVFQGTETLPESVQHLITAAQDAAKKLAYAPYSNFKVGVSLLLSNGAIVLGTNQENAASPIGVCAEKIALGNAAVNYPEAKIDILVVAYYKDQADENMLSIPLSPCGSCRQTILEYTQRQNQPIEIYLCSLNNTIFRLKNGVNLLPLSFGPEML